MGRRCVRTLGIVNLSEERLREDLVRDHCMFIDGGRYLGEARTNAPESRLGCLSTDEERKRRKKGVREVDGNEL